MACAVGELHAAHVIDHDRHRHARQRRCQLRQVARIDPQLQMPAELGHGAVERLDVGEPNTVAVIGPAVAAEFIGAQAAHARRVPFLQGIAGELCAADRHAAQALRRARQRVEHGPVVAAIGAGLHQHAARRSRADRAGRHRLQAGRRPACSCAVPHKGTAQPDRRRDNDSRKHPAAGFHSFRLIPPITAATGKFRSTRNVGFLDRAMIDAPMKGAA